MSGFETITCEQCGTTFLAHPGSRAADTRYCSPRCHERGAGLA
ncbi:MAG: hypothetical protein ABEJ57_05750 [Halobacteriaceae archaeon]